MSSFAGFSEADILKAQNGQVPNTTSPHKDLQSRPSLNLQKQKRIKLRNESKIHGVLTSKIKPIEPIPEEAKLQVPEVTEVIEPDTVTRNEAVQPEDIVGIEKEKKFVDLEEFQQRQKLMEEQNNRRKELLARALEDRTKRTMEEQQRLNEIQNEFRRLDANLSNDVKILRKQIELASVDYMEAQKRYNKIEREFLDAKLHLHQKLEKKEMLTEYLCAIIEKNEERKAEKLNELLQKLELSDNPSEQCPEITTSGSN